MIEDLPERINLINVSAFSQVKHLIVKSSLTVTIM